MIEVPKNWKDIIRIDEAAGNDMWQDSVEKYISTLMYHEYFDFKYPDYEPSVGYQCFRLHLVYDINPVLKYKSRLVCDGSNVDPWGLSIRAIVLKRFSVLLLGLIADYKSLKVLCGEVGNDFIQANTKEKMCIPVVDLSLVKEQTQLQ